MAEAVLAEAFISGGSAANHGQSPLADAAPYRKRARIAPRPLSIPCRPGLAAALVRRHRPVDRAAAKGTADAAEDRTERAVAAARDLAADHRTADAADDQAGRAVRMAAIGVAVTRVDARGVMVATRLRAGNRNRHGGGDDDCCGAERHDESAHNILPCFGLALNQAGTVTLPLSQGLHEPETTSRSSGVRVMRGGESSPRYPRYPQFRNVVCPYARLGFSDTIMTVRRGCGSEKSQKHQLLMPGWRTGAARKPFGVLAEYRSVQTGPASRKRRSGGRA